MNEEHTTSIEHSVSFADRERVVITGLGAVTPNGLDMASTWDAVVNGRSGIGRIERFDTSDFDVRIAGEVRGFDAVAHLGRKGARRADRHVQMALVAASEALRSAELKLDGVESERTGVYIASGAGGIETYVEQQHAMDARGPRALSPLLIPMIVVDSASVQVAARFGARGPSLGISSACSSSLDSIGLATEAIRRGDADIMLAGGSEAAVTPLAIAGFDRMRALSRRNDDPAAASRPFDRSRDGFVLSEGAAVVVLESAAHALQRGAQILTEVRAYAACTDISNLTAPEESGRSATYCMSHALRKAGLAPEEVDYVCAHATSTPIGDIVEARAIRAVFGDHVSDLPVSSTKSTTGHLLGAAGALAVALTCYAFRDGRLPPTTNLVDPDPGETLRHVANVAESAHLRSALVPSYGFGGHNTALILARVP